ncbi:yellow-c [Carabus blaptoides fortunei]
MINDYLNRDLSKSTITIGHLCWKIDEKYDLVKLLLDNNHTISIANSDEQIIVNRYFGHMILYILDLNCNNSRRILQIANEKNLLSAPYRWLLLSNSSDQLQDFTTYNIYPDSNIVICEKTEETEFIFTEIYRYSRSRTELITRQFANWTEQNSLGNFKPRILSQERRDLNDTLLSVCIVILDNDTINHLEDFRFKHIDSISKVSYIFSMHLLEYMNARSSIITVDTWGYDSNSGMVGYLVRGEAEIGGTSLFITQERLDLIHYAGMTTPTKVRFVFRRPPLSYESNIFTLPFTRPLWICSFCFVMLAIVLLYYTVYWEWQYPDLEISETALKADFMEVVMLAVGALSQQGTTHEPRSGAGKIIMIFTFVALMFLYVSYSANIVALLQSSATNIKTLEDLLESRLTLGCHDTPYNRHFMSTATESTRKAIYERKLAPPGQKAHFMDLVEGVRGIRQGFFAFHMEVGPGYKLISDTFLESEKCGLQEINFLTVVDTYLSIPKESSYKEIIRIGLRKIMESGIQSRVIQKIYTEKPKCHIAGELDEVFAWKELDFAWPSPQVKEKALESKEYIPSNNLPLGLDRWNDKLFVTVPRWKAGVATSLAYIPLNSTDKSPQLIPYPSWEANAIPPADNTGEKTKEDSIVSVFRIRVDACDRLWVMDTGLADILGAPRQITKPALLVFDLKTDKLLKRYEFKPTDLKEDSFFANVIVDVTKNTCDDAYAYIPDLGGYGIVVFSLRENNSWRIQHNFFHFDPLAGDYNVGGVNFQWTDGVFGLALSNMQPDGYRTMYFHALSSTKEFAVSTAILRNSTIATDPLTYHQYKLLGDRGTNTQAAASYIDEKTGVLFLTQVNKNAVACWNPTKPLTPENLALVAQDEKALIFPNDLTIDREGQLWVLSDKMPTFIYKSLNPQDVNYRILKLKISDAITKTPCA